MRACAWKRSIPSSLFEQQAFYSQSWPWSPLPSSESHCLCCALCAGGDHVMSGSKPTIASSKPVLGDYAGPQPRKVDESQCDLHIFWKSYMQSFKNSEYCCGKTSGGSLKGIRQHLEKILLHKVLKWLKGFRKLLTVGLVDTFQKCNNNSHSMM